MGVIQHAGRIGSARFGLHLGFDRAVTFRTLRQDGRVVMGEPTAAAFGVCSGIGCGTVDLDYDVHRLSGRQPSVDGR